MSTYARDWRPRNLGGSTYYDPRRELEYWADSVPPGQAMVAVPVSTLRAAAAVRECRETAISQSDENGPLPAPVSLLCRQPEGHRGDHSNGAVRWS